MADAVQQPKQWNVSVAEEVTEIEINGECDYDWWKMMKRWMESDEQNRTERDRTESRTWGQLQLLLQHKLRIFSQPLDVGEPSRKNPRLRLILFGKVYLRTSGCVFVEITAAVFHNKAST